jgi:hypothetical protein
MIISHLRRQQNQKKGRILKPQLFWCNSCSIKVRNCLSFYKRLGFISSFENEFALSFEWENFMNYFFNYR